MLKIKLSGNYYQIGKQYGQQAGKKIKLMSNMMYFLISAYKAPGAKPFKPNLWSLPLVLLQSKKNKARWDKWAADYVPFIEKYHPDAVMYLKGLADGAGITFEQALFLNISTESLYTCSIWGASGSATKTGEPLIGMNGDETEDATDFYAFVEVEPENGYSYKGISITGLLLAGYGMNEHGLAAASTLLFCENPDPKPRPPFIVYERLLTECKNVAEARALFEQMPELNSSMVWYVADHDTLLKVEFTSQGKEYQEIKNGSSGNTNLATLPKAKALDLAPKMKRNENMNALFRMKRMKKLLEMHDGKIDAAVMKQIASDHGEPGTDTHMKSICQHPKKPGYNAMTLGSFVAQPRDKKFWFTNGKPCQNEWEEVNL